MRRLVLWDVDHTLIENGGVSKQTYSAAFETLTGRPATEPVETDGRTDPGIMADLLERHGLPARWDREVERALVTALASRADELANRGYALPGAASILASLQNDLNVMQSVLTGNIRPNAIRKLETFALDGYIDFEVGGYGSDDRVRAGLVGIAQRRAGAKFGDHFGPANTVLIGDTTRDVEAGLRGGAMVIGVATGTNTENELRSAGAALVLPDLTDTAAVLRAILRVGLDQARVAGS